MEMKKNWVKPNAEQKRMIAMYKEMQDIVWCQSFSRNSSLMNAYACKISENIKDYFKEQGLYLFSHVTKDNTCDFHLVKIA